MQKQTERHAGYRHGDYRHRSQICPVVISSDDELIKNTKDATKDFPGVTAADQDGEITLTGNITRERLQKLMISLNALHPKKINNQLNHN